MLVLESSPAAYIRIRARGRLTAADYSRFEAAFAAELKRRKRRAQRVRRTGEHATPIPLLLDMRGFRGWTPAGFLLDLRWDLRNRRTFSKIAVVGDRSWHRWITAAGAPLFRTPMKFVHSEMEAERWLS